MNWVRIFLACFVLFALLGFTCTIVGVDTNSKTPYDWRYAIGVVPFIEHNTPGNAVAKVLGVMSGYSFGVWAAEAIQHKPLSPNPLADFSTPSPTPIFDVDSALKEYREHPDRLQNPFSPIPSSSSYSDLRERLGLTPSPRYPWNSPQKP
jgi:hypothetical protein